MENVQSSVLHAADRALTFVERLIVVVLLFVSAGILVLDILCRSMAGFSIAWAPELARYAIVWLVFIGGSMGARTGAGISIDVIGELFPEHVVRRLVQVAMAVSAGTAAAMAYFGLTLVRQMYGFGQTSPSLLWPMWAVYLAIPVGFGLMAIRFMQDALTVSLAKRQLVIAETSA